MPEHVAAVCLALSRAVQREVPSASGACVRTAPISCRFDGFTSARPATTTVGTVSFPSATDRTNALAPESSDIDLPVAQPRELQAQQQVQAEHAVRPPVDDDLILLLVHSIRSETGPPSPDTRQ